MQNTYFFMLLVFLISTGSWAKSEQALFNQVSPAIFQIKTSTDEASSKASYGSGFAIEKTGLLITNYHVIATSLQEEEQKYNIYVLVDEKPIPAQIVAVDIIHDLALLKIDYTFKRTLKLTKKIPLTGETIFSLGLPKDLKLSLIKGTFNGILKHTRYERILMSSPINAGMSGGPTLNTKSEVIGVNVSVLRQSQNISFCVPIKHVYDLIDAYKKNTFNNLKDKIHLFLQAQLIEIQQTLIEDMQKNKGENSKLDNWTFAPPSTSLKCWSKNEKEKNKTYEYKQQTCHLPADAYISDTLSSGSYNLNFISINNLKRTKIQFYNVLESSYNATTYDFRDEFSFITNKEVISRYSCDNQIIVNQNNIPFKINFCMNTYIRYTGLYNIIVKGVSLLKGNEAFFFAFSMQGFSQTNIEKFIRHQLDHINFEGKR
ncbi:MAG: hypothetical protein A2381_16590 [Bdellovibrionales bacterium RIFOXYB1_FULL_37_110]|nr:MAG: hypothetical protein A2181_07595 [Bdellovibrionales bacterium RIFOXYA1_FULL_38_20]OFZ50016.1 MAG: hypothetical protein A2417_18425 [Bdellovibrionales bacterium RIFOXYC1_FULL_37_79]OFZ59922.1 MAG: hypothetical protein A2381_16590 [Bdellovibrionales bacterium RIFOXYB1_FULL_37_110]OFZ63893.1 MAG: hypothetical protein A2577_05780 [Bdellovibrionales bacterium RIFOXYD1_FULL_36_51]